MGDLTGRGRTGWPGLATHQPRTLAPRRQLTRFSQPKTTSQLEVRCRLVALVVGGAFVIAGCDVIGPAPGLREYRPVSAVVRPATEVETKKILIYGPRELFSGLPDSGSETFTEDGQYRSLGIVHIDGLYSVSGNRFCVSVSRETPLDSCRNMFIGPDGPHFEYEIVR